MFLAMSIIIIGVTLLLDSLGIISSFGLDVVWPSLLILCGVSVIVKRRSEYSCCEPSFSEEPIEPKSVPVFI